MPDELSGRVEALSGEVAGLSQATDRLGERIGGLREDLGRLADRQSRTERRGVWTAITVTIALVFVVVAGYLAVAAQRNSDEQEQLRNEVLCPLYGIFIGAYDPSSRDKSPDPQARQKYEDAYAQIRHGWEVMQCTSPVVPKRSN